MRVARRGRLTRGEWVRNLALAGVAAVFLSFARAFGTEEQPFAIRLAYWSFLLLSGTAWGNLMGDLLIGGGRLQLPVWGQAAVLALVTSLVMTPLVWVAPRLIAGTPIRLEQLPVLVGPVVMISLAMTGLNMLVMSRRRAAAEPAAPEPPKFLERLPLKLRGAEVWAVEAEDHYLRLHTSKGQDLILMRLSDAIAELEGIEGLQVHRSWWVAREAITDARRGDGRATLTLKDGAEVPVSRTYARELRDRRWI